MTDACRRGLTRQGAGLILALLIAMVVLAGSAHAQYAGPVHTTADIERFQTYTGPVSGDAQGAWRDAFLGNRFNRAMAVTPVFNQRIIHGLPDNWKAGTETSGRDTYSMEFLPEKQSAQNWREMIMLKAFRGAARNPQATPKALLAQVAAELRGSCGDKAITLSLGDTKLDGQDAHGAVMGCTGPPEAALAPGNKGLGEMAFYLAIRSSDDLFVLQRSVRAEAFQRADAPINAANAYLYFRELQPVKLCERDLPEMACIQRQQR